MYFVKPRRAYNLSIMIKKLLFLLAFSLTLAGCAGQTPQSTAVPRFEQADCPFSAPQDVKVSCGYLVAPEDRTVPITPGARTIRLAVGIFKSTASTPAPDPIVYLEGGPGGSPLRGLVAQFTYLFSGFLAQRDVILLDQRGTGYSEPALDCPEVTQSEVDLLSLNLPPAEVEQRSEQALLACRTRLANAGINLAAYTSAANAADLADLRTALGYAEWNLYGTSYGTRLALTELRDHPQGIRSVVIDSVYPPQVDLTAEIPTNASRALELLFSTCAADAGCNKAYPNLKQVFYDTVKKLNQQPGKVKVTLPDMGLPALKGKQVDALVTGDDLVSTVFQAMYVTAALPSLPEIIQQTARGTLEPLSELAMQFKSSEKDVSVGMNSSVQCGEEIAFSQPQAVAAAIQAHPELGGAMGTADGPFSQCKLWNVPAAAALENQPVSSAVPTLVLSGQFDPITPPAWGKLTASTLSRSYYFEIPAAGHGSSLTEACPRRLALAFFDNPAAAPGSACLKDLSLVFSLPVDKLDVPLAPFESRQLGTAISGVAPANWRGTSTITGFYSPSGDVSDATQLLIQGLPVGSAQLLQTMSDQLSAQGVTLTPTGETRNTPNGLTFTLYQAGGGLSKVDLAMATDGATSLMVVLQAPLAQRSALYQAVFLPVLDGLKVIK